MNRPWSRNISQRNERGRGAGRAGRVGGEKCLREKENVQNWKDPRKKLQRWSKRRRYPSLLFLKHAATHINSWVRQHLLTLASRGDEAANRKARISTSICYINLFLSTTCALHLQPVASLLRCTAPSSRPPSALRPRRWTRKHVCVLYTSALRVCVCVCATVEHVGASNGTVESGRVRVAFCGGVKW